MKLWNFIKSDFLPAFSLLQLFASVGTAVYTLISKTKLSVFEWVLIGVIILETALIFGRLIWQRCSYQSYYYPRSRIYTNYSVLSKTVEYNIKRDTANGEHKLNYARELDIKAKVNNFDNFVDYYHWSGENKKQGTGGSTIGKPNPAGGIDEITDRERIGIWTYFRVRINRTLAKGQTHHVRYEWPEIDQVKSSKPFFSTTTEVATKELILKLDLGEEYKGQEIWKQVFRANESLLQIVDVEKVNLDPHGRYEWKVENVKRFRYYRIIWNWTAGKAPEDKLNLMKTP